MTKKYTVNIKSDIITNKGDSKDFNVSRYTTGSQGEGRLIGALEKSKVLIGTGYTNNKKDKLLKGYTKFLSKGVKEYYKELSKGYQDAEITGSNIDSIHNIIGKKIDVGLESQYDFETINYKGINLSNETSGMIIGGYEEQDEYLSTFLSTLYHINNSREVTSILLDINKSIYYKTISNYPHVKGYFTDATKYIDILKEVSDEMEYRKELLVTNGYENFTKLIQNNGACRKLSDEYSEILVVIPHIDTVMEYLSDYYGEENIKIFKELRSILSKITQEGRSLGIRLLVTSENTTDRAIPKAVTLNMSLKIVLPSNYIKDSRLSLIYSQDDMDYYMKNKKKITDGTKYLTLSSYGDKLSFVEYKIVGDNKYSTLQIVTALSDVANNRLIGLDYDKNINPYKKIKNGFNKNELSK